MNTRSRSVSFQKECHSRESPGSVDLRILSLSFFGKPKQSIWHLKKCNQSSALGVFRVDRANLQSVFTILSADF